MANNDQNEKHFSRRDFLKTTGAATGGIIGGSLLGGLVGFNINSEDETKVTTEESTAGSSAENNSAEQSNLQEARMFFKQKEDFDVLSAATETIFPEDENGPGAIGLGVPFFIDKQLAGPWGKNSRMYMNGPFGEGDSPMTKDQMFLIGVRGLNSQAHNDFDTNFYSLEEDQQIEILKKFESDKSDMDGFPTSKFFGLLRSKTIEGAYADPLYGGNKNMAGWKMKEYPGVQMSYRNMLSEDGEINDEFILIDPKSLSDYM